jgi:hypothetical protein
VAADLDRVSFLWSYPNMMPLARISHIFEHIGAPESAKVVVVQRL